MMKIIQDLWHKRRDIVSDGFDESLNYLSKIFPMKIHEITCGSTCWTWKVPQKWSVKEAWIKGSNGDILLDLKDHPLHVVGSSLPIDKKVNKEELFKHLHSNQKQPNAIPWVFKYYDRDWGFCIEHEKLKNFVDDNYHVYIDSEDTGGSLKVGEITIPGESDEIIFLVAHLCHPAQVNDDLTGVAVLMDVIQALSKKKNYYTYKAVIVPETIGSIAYLSQNEDLISKARYGIFFEMLGNDNNHVLQYSRQGNTKLDRIAEYVIQRREDDFRSGPYGEVVGNDEGVFNGPGINIPMISISRWPYPEYHTSKDNLSIVTEDRLEESKRIFLEILDILDTDYIPRRTFKGPVFLSGHGLWVPKEVNRPLNHNISKIMYRLEGEMSVFDIADELHMDFGVVLEYVNKFFEKGFITRIK
ncbi:MAG: DUF4910 domain-containing protein [Candidatus Magasanikbacteria bacterium]